MKGAKELADTLREFCVIESQDDGVAIIAHLDAKAAIDSAELGEVETIKSRFDGGTAGDNILQTVRDIGTLLAIVQRQEYEALESCGAHEEKDLALSRANTEIIRLTERLRMMEHGEAEALKMMGAERQRADRLAAELATAKERAAKDDAGVTIHACPPKGDGMMPCCGRTPFEVMGDRMSTKPEVVNCDRVRLLTEKTESGLTILRLRAEATEQRERAVASELNAREQKGLADLAMQVVATRTQELMVAEERARALANGIAAYRAGGYTAAQVWENEEGKAVPR